MWIQFKWWGIEESFLSSPFSCFWAICKSLSVQSIELYTLHEFKITLNWVHCGWSMYFLQTWIRNNAASLLWLLLFDYFLERFWIILLIFDAQQTHLNLKDIFIGLLTPELPLLNYLILIGKIYLWACRRNKELPSIRGFKSS